MMDQNAEMEIRKLMVDGYMDAIGFAESEAVSIQDFQHLARQILLGLFLSVNEIGMDNVSGENRLRNLEHNLKAFMDAGMTMFDQQLIDEENAARAGVPPRGNQTSDSALRLCPDKSLTFKNTAGGIDPRQEQGEKHE